MGKINEWSQEKGVAGNATKLEKNVKPEFKILLIILKLKMGLS